MVHNQMACSGFSMKHIYVSALLKLGEKTLKIILHIFFKEMLNLVQVPANYHSLTRFSALFEFTSVAEPCFLHCHLVVNGYKNRCSFMVVCMAGTVKEFFQKGYFYFVGSSCVSW